ncbi:MAG: hypothetical protein DWH79_03275 [Planctomycetota bacterium]|nr:MAG: hypothetical protein DWH79_03275 [Planctomycetota bacterium]
MSAGSNRSSAGRLAALVALLSAVTVHAAPPEATRLFPAGGKRATTVTVKVAGSFPVWPAGVWLERAGTAWQPAAESGSFQVTINADAPLGPHLVRFHSADGASAVRRFVVGHIAESEEQEPNDKPATAGVLATLPMVVNGTLGKSGDVDGFRVRLAAGETLVAQADAQQTLRTSADLTLEVADQRRSILARNLDAAGLDPRIVFRAPVDGDYTVRVYGFPETPDSTIALAGGEGYVYRLTVAKGGFLVAALPAAITRGVDATLTPRGWNLPPTLLSIASAATLPAATGAQGRVTVAIDGIGGQLAVPVVERAVESDVAGLFPPGPVTFSGHFDEPRQRAVHRFNATKDSRWTILCEGLAAGFSTDPLLAIEDADGKRLASTDEPAANLAWQAPSDGLFAAVVTDRRGLAGPAHSYRLRISPQAADVLVSCDLDRITGPAGKPVEISVTIDRRHGFSERLGIELLDPPAGVSAAEALSPADGDAAKKLTLLLTAAGPFSGELRIVARSLAAGREQAPALPVRCGPEGLPGVWLGITPAVP